MYFERQKFMSVASIIAAILNVLLNYIFIRSFGYIAAGYTTVVCYLLYSIGHFIFCKKVCKEKIGHIELYDTKAILLISTMVLLASILFNFLYLLTFVRYILFVLIIVIGIYNLKSFKQSLTNH